MVPPPLDEDPDEPFYAQQMPVPPRPQDFGQSAGSAVPTIQPQQPAQSAPQPPGQPQQPVTQSRQPVIHPQQPAQSAPQSQQSANQPSVIPGPSPAQQPPAPIPPRPHGFGQPGQSSQAPQSAARSNSIASRIRENHGTGQPQSNGFGNGGFNNGEFGGYRGNSGYQGNSGYPGSAGNSGYAQASDGQNDLHDDNEVSADDPTIAQSNLVGIDVVLDTFHGTVIEEIIGKREI